MPEGFELQEGAAEKVNGLFKELGLSQEAGQKLVNFYADQLKAQIEGPYEAYANLRRDWRDQMSKHPELGSKLPEVKATINRSLDGLGKPEVVAKFKEAMDLTGAGDNPAFIEAFYYLASKAVEGKHVSGKGPAGTGQTGPGARPQTAAQALYPNLPSANQS